jgi:hypothetical protein
MYEAFWRYAYTLNEIGTFLDVIPPPLRNESGGASPTRWAIQSRTLVAPVQVLQCN